jgi:hypothetical protein
MNLKPEVVVLFVIGDTFLHLYRILKENGIFVMSVALHEFQTIRNLQPHAIVETA